MNIYTLLEIIIICINIFIILKSNNKIKSSAIAFLLFSTARMTVSSIFIITSGNPQNPIDILPLIIFLLSGIFALILYFFKKILIAKYYAFYTLFALFLGNNFTSILVPFTFVLYLYLKKEKINTRGC